MKKFFRKNKKWLTIVAVVLVTATVVGIVAASTNLIGKITNSNIGGFRDVNDDNLINVEMYEHLDNTKASGVKISVNNDGVIILDGKATENSTIELGTFKIVNPENHSSDSSLNIELYLKGCLDGAADKYYLVLQDEYDSLTAMNLNSSIPGALVKSIGAPECGFTVSLEIKKGTDFDNVKIYPGVYTDSAAEFYAK